MDNSFIRYLLAGIAGLVMLCVAACVKAPLIPAPVLLALTPESAKPMEPVYLIGKGLQLGHRLDIVGDTVSATYELGEFNVILNDSLLFLAPALPPDVYDVILTSADDSASHALELRITARGPVIQQIHPSTACAGDTLCILGNYFSANDLEISFGNLTLHNTVSVSPTRICLFVPENGVPGSIVNVSVSTQGGDSNVRLFQFCTGPDGPEITDISPDTVKTGEIVIINGRRFVPGSTQVQFVSPTAGSFTANPEQIDTTRIEVRVPENAGTGLIRVITPIGIDAAHIVVIGDIEISQIIPQSNPVGGPVLIFGSGLESVRSIHMGAAEITGMSFGLFNSPRKLIATNVPASLSPGTLPIVLESIDGIQSAPVPYDILATIANNPPAGAGFNVVVPNIPGAYNIGDISNSWLRVDYVNGQPVNSTFEMFQESEANGIKIITLNNGDTLLYNTSTLELSGPDMIGWLDGKYLDGSSEEGTECFVMTPLSAGDQFLLYRPRTGGIDSISPQEVNRGDSVRIYGWPFFPGVFDGFDVTINIGNNPIEQYEYRSIRELRFRVPVDLIPDIYDLQFVDNIAFKGSNKTTIVIN